MNIDAQKSTLRSKLNELESNYELYKVEAIKKDPNGRYIIKEEPLKDEPIVDKDKEIIVPHRKGTMPESIYDIPLEALPSLLDRMYTNLEMGKTKNETQQLNIVESFLKATKQKEYVYLAELLRQIAVDNKKSLYKETGKTVLEATREKSLINRNNKEIKTINKELEHIKKDLRK